MANTTTPIRKKFSVGKLILSCLLVGLIAIIAHFILKYLYSFVWLSEDTDAKIFYSWRTKYADKHMIGPYEHVADKTWDTSNKELKDFLEFAQGSEKMLDDKGPEHFPRGSMQYYTHSFEWNDSVFLPVRKHLMTMTTKDASENKEMKVIYLDLPNFKLSDLTNNDLENVDNMHSAMNDLVSLLECLINIKKEDKLLDNTDLEKNPIINHTFDLWNNMGYEYTVRSGDKKKTTDLAKSHVLKFYKHLARASTTVFESFMYSRMFFMFYFYTTAAFPDEDNPEKRFEKATKMFTHIMSRAYKDPADAKNESKFAAAFRKFYSPKMLDLPDFNSDEATNVVNEIGIQH